MAILTARTKWKRERPATKTTRGNGLTTEERANVRAAVRFLFRRFGSWPALASAMGAHPKTIRNASASRGQPTAMLAIQVSRVAFVSVERRDFSTTSDMGPSYQRDKKNTGDRLRGPLGV